VAAGLAEHLGWSLPLVRILLVVGALAGGAGILFYLWLWALTPLRPADDDVAGVRRAVPGAAVLVALAAVAALVGAVVPRTALPTTLVPGALETALFALAAVAWSLGFDRSDPGRGVRYGVVVRSVAAGLMILLGIILLLREPPALTAVVAVLLIVLGSGVLFIPRVVTLWSEVLAERAGRVREEQRAEIAAHLHDSVLQTLALIQNRAGASSEVARLARAQERELRDWLFAGTGPVSEDLATELREIASEIELEYPARIDVVTTGETTVASAAIVAASREAMLNAARHAGGEVSVYLETSPEATDVFIRDRGPGVDLAGLPDDRLGIRESIIGRMTRAGGTATVAPGAGGVGTEVHLHLDASLAGGAG
jgi:signal transduction histidine kinase